MKGLKNSRILVAILLMAGSLFAQENANEQKQGKKVENYHGTRIINGHSVETLEKQELEFRVEHRFGDIAGANGGTQTFFGFDNSADIRLAFEYGITDDLMIGFGRSKGTNAPYRSLLDGFVKWKFIQQREAGMPVSMAVLGTATFTYMTASDDITNLTHFPKTSHRFAYATQVNVSRKFGDWLSLSLLPTITHRNYVNHDDLNTMFSMGSAAKIKVTKKTALLLEYYHNFHSADFRADNQNSLALAFEWKTFGHDFTINLTNSRGFGETQFIPYTYSNWLDGEFRLGFSISRSFYL